ncbi:hypothetical protein S40293_11337 [Stachybotrys chartarum IBT 40293]|nr:hypothetical protein S40293_11337 [Stachybotrys chartarum IBT 40293]
MQLRYASLNLAAQFHSAAAARCPRAATAPAPHILPLGCCHFGNHFGREARASARIAHHGSQPNRGGPITVRHISRLQAIIRNNCLVNHIIHVKFQLLPISCVPYIVQDPPNHGALGTVAQAWRAGTARRITPSL